jgi:hypothetical protein
VHRRRVVERARDRRVHEPATHERTRIHGIERCAHDLAKVRFELWKGAGQA